MPKYNYDPSKTTAAIEVFPADDYEFIIGEPKTFLRKNTKDEDSYGVMFPLQVAEGELKGKRTIYSCYLHSEGGQTFTKQFQLAVYGYKRDAAGEREFNSKFGDADWTFDPESSHLGDAWRKMAGSRVIGALTVGKNNKTDEPQQQFKSWRPAISA